MIPRVEKDVIAFAERTLQLSVFSLWELVGHLQKAWEEQLMKRSNSLENCLTLLLYFWISPHGQGLLRSWFPPEVSWLGMQWNLWSPGELERRPAGIREWSEYFFKEHLGLLFSGTKNHRFGKGLSPSPAQCRKFLCFIPHRALFALLLNASNDRRLTILREKLFYSQKSFPFPEHESIFLQVLLAFWYSYKTDMLLFPRWSLNIWRQWSCTKLCFMAFSSASWPPLVY